MYSVQAYPCLCCGYKTLTKEPPGSYEICPICFWEDSLADWSWQHASSNGIGLIQAQRNFLAFGACDRQWLDSVRCPTEEEERNPNWQTIEVTLHAKWHELLNQFNPSDYTLWVWLRSRIDDAMLEKIAAADYGMDFENYLRVLKRVRDEPWQSNEVVVRPSKGEDLVPVWYQAVEVLQLMSWSKPENFQQDSEKTIGHLMRAFCCAVLLRMAIEPQNIDTANINNEPETIIQLIASVLNLGQEACEFALQLMCWRMLSLPVDNEECPFFAMGILLLATALYRSEKKGYLLRQLSELVLSEEERIRIALAEEFRAISPQWLLGLRGSDYITELRVDQWKNIAQQVLLNPPEPHPQEVAGLLREIGTRLVEG
ncbi:MAG: hypothetical protein KME06_01985 [Kastovskya adunca ATA6-11-RM4]|jgi:hypothetical protein|nr:hypothetical protein [Kastovskya adunca ATA6-11-RM4]